MNDTEREMSYSETPEWADYFAAVEAERQMRILFEYEASQCQFDGSCRTCAVLKKAWRGTFPELLRAVDAVQGVL